MNVHCIDLEQAARDISLNMSSDKIEFMYFKPDRNISTFNDKPLNLIYLGSNIVI